MKMFVEEYDLYFQRNDILCSGKNKNIRNHGKLPSLPQSRNSKNLNVSLIYIKYFELILTKKLVFKIPFRDLMVICKNQRTIIPNFVKESVEYILCNGLTTTGLFKEIPSLEEAESLRIALDREEAVSFEETSPLTVAWLLLRWLRELPEPLIPYEFYDDIVKVTCRFSNTDIIINY